MLQSSEVYSPDRSLIASLKAQDRKYKKWAKYKALGISIRRAKPHALRSNKIEHHFTSVQSKDEDESTVCGHKNENLRSYQVVLGSALEARRNSRLKDQQYPLHKRQTHRTRINAGLSERLKVIVPELIVPAKADIDPGFFSTIEGRPVKKPYKRRNYLKRVVDLLFTRAIIFDISENVFELRKQVDDKEKRLTYAEKSLPFHEKESWNSIYKDFDLTAEVHKRQKDAQKKLVNARQRKEKLRSMVQVVCCNLYSLEEHWRSLKVYQAFLYRVSPLPWRKIHDRIHVEGDKLILAQMPKTHDRHNISSIDPSQPLEELIKIFYKVTKDEEPPELYFSDPKQLKDYYDYMVELNSNTLSNAMMLEEESKELNKFYKELKGVCEKELQKIHDDHDKFLESFSWLEKRKDLLHEIAQKEKDDIMNVILSAPCVEVRAHVEGAYNMLLNPTKLKVGLVTMLNHLAEDVSMVIWEVSNLPPALLQRLLQKKEEEIRKAEQADNYYKKVKIYERKVKDIFFRRIIPKHQKGLKLRSHPPEVSEREEEKPKVVVETDFYTEDIFSVPLIPEDIAERVSEDHETGNSTPELSWEEMTRSAEEMTETETLSKQSQPSFSKQRVNSKSLESTLSSIGLDDEGSSAGLHTLIPNRTIEIPPIETKLHPGKIIPKPMKKPSLVVTDMSKRKVSLLTNYEKSFSAAETEHDTREMSFVDVVKTTKIKGNLMRWKSIFSTEKEKISKSSLFQPVKTTVPDPYIRLIQQKIRHTSKTRYSLKSDSILVSPLIQSSYIPSLPTITESDISEKSVLSPIDSIAPMLDHKLRECKIRYYVHKVSREDKRN